MRIVRLFVCIYFRGAYKAELFTRNIYSATGEDEVYVVVEETQVLGLKANLQFA